MRRRRVCTSARLELHCEVVEEALDGLNWMLLEETSELYQRSHHHLTGFLSAECSIQTVFRRW